MKLEELSVGDWVRLIPNEWDNAPHTIKCMYENSLLLDGRERPIHISSIQPVAISARHLEANDFVKQEDEFWGEYICAVPEGRICVSFKKEGCMVLVLTHSREVALSASKIYNIHQLQHALRLAGIEKQIELE